MTDEHISDPQTDAIVRLNRRVSLLVRALVLSLVATLILVCVITAGYFLFRQAQRNGQLTRDASARSECRDAVFGRTFTAFLARDFAAQVQLAQIVQHIDDYCGTESAAPRLELNLPVVSVPVPATQPDAPTPEPPPGTSGPSPAPGPRTGSRAPASTTTTTPSGTAAPIPIAPSPMAPGAPLPPPTPRDCLLQFPPLPIDVCLSLEL